MLNIKELTEIGKKYCKNKIGEEKLRLCAENGFFGYEERENGVFCNLGCSLQSDENGSITLTEGNDWDYYAECFVKTDGEVMDEPV
ncbi:MAG: hypothetical protein IKP88_21525 [Lachnospiraceae bacterium]|nr:hypothetical protein [Lachnospiraceae bacterium]